MHEFLRDLFFHLRAEWRTKLWLGAGLTLLFCAGYFATGHNPLRTPITLPLTPIDRAIGFAPSWTWGYLSLYFLLPMAWLATTREQLRRYAAGFIALSAVAFAVFLICPVAGPRPVDPPAGGPYAWLIRYDTPLNSFPSLHVALAVYTVCFITQVASRRMRVLILPLAFWAGIISYSALTTKQHYFIDVPAGAALGCVACAVAFRWRRNRFESARPPYVQEATA